MRSTNPYPFMEVDAPKKVIGLHNGRMESYLHSSIHSSLDDDVSLHRDILSGRPLDQQKRMDASSVEAPLSDFRGVGTLGELDTVLGVLGKLKEEEYLLPISSSPTLISGSALWEEKNGRNGLPTYTSGMRDVK